MRWPLLLLAGCGRYGFDATDAVDAGISDLVAVYAMDDDPGAGTLRASTAAFDGRCSLGACPTPIAGKFGGGLAFDGNDAVVLPFDLVGSSPYTVAVWIRPQTGAILAKPHSVTDDNDVIGLFIDGRDGAPYFETCSVPGRVGDTLGTTALDLHEFGWRHLAVTWDGTTKRMYVDGVIAVSGAAVLLDSAEPVRIGVDLDLGAPIEQYTGDMDGWHRSEDTFRSSRSVAVCPCPAAAGHACPVCGLNSSIAAKLLGVVDGRDLGLVATHVAPSSGHCRCVLLDHSALHAASVSIATRQGDQ